MVKYSFNNLFYKVKLQEELGLLSNQSKKLGEIVHATMLQGIAQYVYETWQ